MASDGLGFCSAERAVIEYDPALWTPEKLAEVRSSRDDATAIRSHRCLRLGQEIEDMGFEASPIQQLLADTVILQIYGMT
jgi:Cu+-exporting ATPase